MFPSRKNNIPLCTTAYFLLGKKCSGKCAFCIQSSNSISNDSSKLSRISWPELHIPLDKIISIVNNVIEFQRICIQATKCLSKSDRSTIKDITHISNKPISLSMVPKDIKEAENLLSLPNVDFLNLSLDSASTDHFKDIKGENPNAFWEKLSLFSSHFPKKIRTHIIIGMGESDRDLIDTMFKLKRLNIIPSLFAFFPLKGTPMQHLDQSPRNRYRVFQLIRELIFFQNISKDLFHIDGNRLTGIDIEISDIRKIASSGEIFMTRGCPGCNRPYYNERPSQIPYNFHEKPNKKNIQDSIEDILSFFAKS